jgi:hypothetical protein
MSRIILSRVNLKDMSQQAGWHIIKSIVEHAESLISSLLAGRRTPLLQFVTLIDTKETIEGKE